MMRRYLSIFLLLLTIGLCPAPSFSAEKGQGKVYVVDGDTFHMNGQKIRICGISEIILLGKVSGEFLLHPLHLDP